MADMKVKVVLQLLKEQFEGAINSAKSSLGALKGEANLSGDAVDKLSNQQQAAASSTRNLGSEVKGMVLRYVSFIAVLEGTRRLIGFADNLQLVAGRVKLASDGAVDFAKNYAALVGISFNTGTALEANGTLFSRLNDTIKDLGGTSGDTLRFIDLLGKGIRISGASTEEANSLVRQLSQSLQSGRLNGDEFNAVMENGKTVGDALADSLRRDRGELRKMAEEGKLTSELVVSSLFKQGEVIDKKFKELPITIGVAFAKIKVAFGSYIYDADTSSKTTATFAGWLETLAGNMAATLDVAIQMGKVAAGIFIGTALNGVFAFIAAKKTARLISLAHSEALQLEAVRSKQAAVAAVAGIEAEIAALKLRGQAFIGSGIIADDLRLKTDALAAAKIRLAEADAVAAESSAKLALSWKALLNPMNLVNLGMAAWAGYMVGDWLRSFETVRSKSLQIVGDLVIAFTGLAQRAQIAFAELGLAFTFNPYKIEVLEKKLADLKGKLSGEFDQLVTTTNNVIQDYDPALDTKPPSAPKINESGAFGTIPAIPETGTGTGASKLAKATLDAELEGIKRKQEAEKAAFDETVARAELAFKQQELNINKLGLSESETAQRILALKKQLEDDKLKAEIDFHKRSYDLEVAALDAKAKAIAGVTNLGLSGGKGSFTAEQSTKSEAIIQRLTKELDLSRAQAAGVVGNLFQESAGLSTTAVNPSSGAFGLAQWLGSRKQELAQFAKERGKLVSDFGVQIDFLIKELETSEKPALNALRKTNTVAAATTTFRTKFERPGESEANDPRRIKAANSAFGAGDTTDNQAQTQERKAIDEQKLAAKASFNAKMRLLGVEENTSATAQSAEQINIDRAALAEKNAIEQQKLDGIRKAALDALELKQLQAQQDLDLGDIGQSEFLAKQQAFADERLDIERDYFDKKRALLGKDSLALLQNSQEQQQIVRDAEQRKKEIIDQAAQNQQAIYEGAVAPFKSAVSQMTSGVLSGQQTIGNAVKNALANILTSYASTFIQERAMWLAQWAWKKTGLVTSLAAEQALKQGDLLFTLFLMAGEALGFVEKETTKTAAMVTGETTREGLSLAAAVKKTFLSAKTAAAGAYASVMELGIPPPFNFILAGVAGAAAFAGTMALGVVGSAKGGEMRVAEDGSPYILHENETVLPSPVADNFRKVVEIVQSYVGGEPTGTINLGLSRQPLQPAGITSFNSLISQNLIPKALSLPKFARDIPQQSQSTATSIARERLKAETSGLVAGAGGSRGDTNNYNINAMDAQTFGAFVSKAANRKHMATAMQAEARGFNRGKK